jgi:diaminopimelate decarboxylase
MAFFYDQGRLMVGESTPVDVSELVAGQTGPVYVYDLDNVVKRFGLLKASLEADGPLRHTIHYAMKANSHPKILKTLADLGAGVDTVSGGEVRLAIEAGVPANRIILSGVAKTVREIEYALTHDIKQINVESPQELLRIAEVAKRLGKTANVAFRMNPDVNPKTHPYITTGFRENKFGMDDSFLPELIQILRAEPKALRLRGLTQHIGSLLFDLEVMKEAIEKTIRIHHRLVGEGFALDRLDIGGGLGIRYETPDESSELELVRQYGRMVRETIKGLDVELLTEPGRVIVGRCGLLVGEVQYIKKAPAKTFAILDTGMHHLLRPALYSAKHRIVPLLEGTLTKQNYDIAGPICESSDILAKDVVLAEIHQGDKIGIADAGAYGFVMASRYNAHELPQEIVIAGGRKV